EVLDVVQPPEAVPRDVPRRTQDENDVWLRLREILPHRVPQVLLRWVHVRGSVIDQRAAGVEGIRVTHREQPEMGKSGGEPYAGVVDERESRRDVVGQYADGAPLRTRSHEIYQVVQFCLGS